MLTTPGASQPSWLDARTTPLTHPQHVKKFLVIAARILFFFVVGVVLLYGPWTPFWTNNFFVAHYHWVAVVSHNHYLRGAISGVGVTDIWIAFQEVRRAGENSGGASFAKTE